MDRKYRVLLLCLLLMLLAGGAGAQQNLDTLWTRTIGGTGFDSIYTSQVTSEGTLLIAAKMTEGWGHPAGIYCLEFLLEDGELISSALFSPLNSINYIDDIRKVGEDIYEVAYTDGGSGLWADARGKLDRISTSGGVLQSTLIDSTYEVVHIGGTDRYLPMHVMRLNDSTFRVSGNAYSIWGPPPNFGSGRWTRVVETQTHGASIYAGEDDYLFFTNEDCVLLIDFRESNDTTTRVSLFCDQDTIATAIGELAFSQGDFGVKMAARSGDRVWFRRYNTSDNSFHLMCTDDALIPQIEINYAGEHAIRPAVLKGNDSGNLLCFGQGAGGFPSPGLRIDVFEPTFGQSIGSWAVAGSSNDIAINVWQLEDSTFLLLTNVQGPSRDLKLTRTHRATSQVFIDPAIVIPDDYTVYPPYPNPFNSQATFTFDIPLNSQASLRIYDITGRQVATLMDEFKDPGTYTVTFDASALPSGVYVYAFDSWNFSHHGKLLLLK